MASTTYVMRPETTKFGKITQNKGHFAIQGHRFWYQWKADTTYYQDDSWACTTH